MRVSIFIRTCVAPDYDTLGTCGTYGRVAGSAVLRAVGRDCILDNLSRLLWQQLRAFLQRAVDIGLRAATMRQIRAQLYCLLRIVSAALPHLTLT